MLEHAGDRGEADHFAAFGLDLDARLHVLLIEGQQHPVAGLQPAHHFGERPVGEAGFQAARFQRVVGAEHQHGAILLDRLGGHAQHVVAAFDDGFDIGAVAHQQALLGRRVEIGFDIDRARLLFHFGHIGRNASHLAAEGLAGHGVERDACGLARLDPGGIDFVHRRADVQAGVVDQIDRRRGGDAGRRGRGVFADFTGDARHDAGKRRGERGAFQPGGADANLRLRPFHIGGQRIAIGLAGTGLGTCVLAALRADKALVDQLLRAIGIAFCVVGHDAGFAAACLAGAQLAGGQVALRGQIAVPQFQQRLPGFDAVAFLHPQLHDLAAGRGRQLGAPAGLDGAGAGIDHGGLRPCRVRWWRVRLRAAAAG